MKKEQVNNARKLEQLVKPLKLISSLVKKEPVQFLRFAIINLSIFLLISELFVSKNST